MQNQQNLSLIIIKYSLLYIALESIQSASSLDFGCFGFNGPLRQYFSLYRAVSQREGERREKG